jgi:23S rRNA (cytosine1962-C5)-methyltransferase
MFCAEEYQLLDFGEGRRLERFGQAIVDRPCPVAEETGKAEPALWQAADVRFDFRDPKAGHWAVTGRLPHPWVVRSAPLAFELKTTPLGQIGLFPEQADNWRWISKQVELGSEAGSSLRVLNLFAYTGGSTLAAAATGAEVVHIDAAKNIVAWARRNARLSGLEDCPIHWIVEDVRKFVRRELRRGSRYDAVILDPPSYGQSRRRRRPSCTRHCASVSRSRMVTVPSVSVWLSTVMQKGVPASSWRR